MINVYCENKGWLFEDLKKLIASYGAVASDYPIRADKYICIRTKECKKSPKPLKTVVQVHDTAQYDLSKYGCASLVHKTQDKTVKSNNKIIIPIGSRDIPLGDPDFPTIGFFCREVNGKKRSLWFEEAVYYARKEVEFDVLMIGEKLEHIAHIGKWQNRAANPYDYKRITALFTASVSPMIPLSAYEAIAAGKIVISTPRQWPFDSEMIKTGDNPIDLANHIIDTVKNKHNYKPLKPFCRNEWAKKQIELAQSL